MKKNDPALYLESVDTILQYQCFNTSPRLHTHLRASIRLSTHKRGVATADPARARHLKLSYLKDHLHTKWRSKRLGWEATSHQVKHEYTITHPKPRMVLHYISLAWSISPMQLYCPHFLHMDISQLLHSGQYKNIWTSTMRGWTMVLGFSCGALSLEWRQRLNTNVFV